MLSGDNTILKLGKRQVTIADMVRLTTDEKYAKETKRLNLFKKYSIYGYGFGLSLYKDEMLIKKNRITKILHIGKRQIYRLQTENDKFIICTSDQEFPTPNGTYRLIGLHPGMEIYTRSIKDKDAHVEKIEYIKKCGVVDVYEVIMDTKADNFTVNNGIVTSCKTEAFIKHK